MESSWLARLKRLHALAQTGLAYDCHVFDQERYIEISAIVTEMLSDITDLPVRQLDTILCDKDRRYATPQIDVRAAVFKEQRILLVKERCDGKWTLPGGYADIGLSASKNVEKEVLEEAGIPVFAEHPYAIRYKAQGEYDPDIRDFYKLFFYCRQADDSQIKTGIETSDVGYFPLDKLPILSTGRVIERDIYDAYAYHNNPASKHIHFD